MSKGWLDILTGLDPASGKAVRVGVDEDHNAIHVVNKVWDPVGLDWVKMQQPQLNVDKMDLTVTMGDVERLLAKQYYKRMKPYAYSPSARPKYICKNTDIDAAESDVDWFIWKYTDADLPEIEGPRTGAVNTEGVIDGLAWNI